jgi:tetratricopeptide (TPR) repeat protein
VPSGLVSAAQLQNPLSKSGRKLLERAQADLKAGKTVEALRELKNALEDPSAAAYAHGILGSEDLKAGQVDAAIDELGEAARLMPGYQVFRSNLADAFLVNHQFQDAEREARQALRLDWASVQAHYILGMALLGQNTRIDEALDHLRAVEGTLACARDALATYQARQLSASVQRAQ